MSTVKARLDKLGQAIKPKKPTEWLVVYPDDRSGWIIKPASPDEIHLTDKGLMEYKEDHPNTVLFVVVYDEQPGGVDCAIPG